MVLDTSKKATRSVICGQTSIRGVKTDSRLALAKSHRGGRANSSLTKLVIQTYGNQCWLRMPGICTGIATTKDHVIPFSKGGTNDLDNFRPACSACNSKRRNLSVGGTGCKVVIITGAPASGKSTYVQEHATPSDVVIDLDAICRSLMPIQHEHTHVYPVWVRHIGIGARQAAIERATRLKERVTVYIIHGRPSQKDLANYRSYRWPIINIDPGRQIVEERARRLRPPHALDEIARYYDLGHANLLQRAAETPLDAPVISSTLASTTTSNAPSRAW